MLLQFFTKERLIAIASLLFVLLIIGGGIFYYFRYHVNREVFPTSKSSIIEKEYEDKGFKKVLSDDQTYSYFVPNYWTETDTSLNFHSDILNGSGAYMSAYPNNLGILTNDLCRDFAKESFNQLKKQDLYINTEFVSSEVKKIGDYEGCYSLADYSRAGNDYSISQFYIFKKDRIYQIFIQTPKLETSQEIASLILNSTRIDNS